LPTRRKQQRYLPIERTLSSNEAMDSLPSKVRSKVRSATLQNTEYMKSVYMCAVTVPFKDVTLEMLSPEAFNGVLKLFGIYAL